MAATVVVQAQPDWGIGSSQHELVLSSAKVSPCPSMDGMGKSCLQGYDSRYIPFLTTILVSVALIAHGLASYASRSRRRREEDTSSEEPQESSRSLSQEAQSLGGLQIVAFMFARLISCVALCTLSVWTLLNEDVPESGENQHKGLLHRQPELSLTMSSAAASFLYLISLCCPVSTTSTTRGANFITFSAAAVYFRRDLWPFATYHETPADLSQGSVLWAKIALMFIAGVIVPLFIPRKYVPVDPKDPMQTTNPEQTCSLFSLVTYTYLDPILKKAYRSKHLSYTELPPLMDSDYSRHLTKRAFRFLDPFQSKDRRHIFFAIMRVFRKQFSILAVMCVGHVASQFAFPVSINRILTYIESGGEGALIKPWVWVILLMGGSLVKILFFQWYIFINTRTHCQAQVIITQLVFEHSLRIRMKADVVEKSSAKVVEPGVGGASEGPSDDSSTASGTASPDSKGEDQGNQRKSTKTISAQASSSTSLAGSSAQPSTSSSKTISPPSPGKGRVVPPPTPQSTKQASNAIGKINNLVTSDLQAIADGVDFLLLFISVPLQIALCIVFLYSVLGWSAFVGLAAILAVGPVPSVIARTMRKNQATKMKTTDARVQDVTEAVSVLRMIKLFGWEQRIAKKIEGKRDEELNWMRKIKMLEYSIGIVNRTVPMFVMLVTYATFTIVMRRELNAKVALDRVQEFLRKTELLDQFLQHESIDAPRIDTAQVQDERIGFKNIEFAWSAENRIGALNRANRGYRLRFNEELSFKPGVLTIISGATGSGKTSMLMALLGEMHAIPRDVESWYNLPREQGIAYAAQESWVQNATIRENILFGTSFDEVRYNKVIHQCALERDLELFDAGDETEVGERGLTLSGGQKARITLARAVYSQAKTVLLDDVLASLDVHTSTWIVNKCLKGDLLRDRTVILVTHNIGLLEPLAHAIVTIQKDGQVRYEERDIKAFVDANEELREEFLADMEKLKRADEDIDGPKVPNAGGKLVVPEEIAQGRVTRKAFSLLLNSMAGDHRLVYFSLLVTSNALLNWVVAFQTWWLGYWGTQYQTHHPSEVNPTYYLLVSSGLVVLVLLVYILYCLIFLTGSLRASRKIHKLLVDSVLMSTFRWLDETPTGRILTRCTQDIRTIDIPIPSTLAALADMTAELVTKFCVVIIFTPIFVMPAASIAALGFYLGSVYLRAQLSVRREMSNAKAPVLSHFSATINGLVSIRAYGAQAMLKQESLRRLDHYLRIARVSFNLNRWINVRIDVLGSVFVGALALYLIYGPPVGAANTGFSINMAIDFATMILWWVRNFNHFEVQSNSLERIQAYLDIEHEPKPSDAGKPPAAWPTSGDIRVENLSARYSWTGPAVLHNLSFSIKSGERVGVVGRTGSGKSSLTLALLRCIITEGTVYYDGLPTNKLNLDSLRANITIIPQTPELLSGTLRHNLDPFEQHDDIVLNDALQSAGLFSLQEGRTEAKLSLDTEIASGGSNLSVGQRQVLALARAIIRRSKLLILDEATSAIDYKTDAIIQTTLREQLDPDVTVITVAHRLQTIMDVDRIMVLDSGHIVEFDSPKALLSKDGTLLKALVDESKDRDVLYQMAGVQSN